MATATRTSWKVRFFIKVIRFPSRFSGSEERGWNAVSGEQCVSLERDHTLGEPLDFRSSSLAPRHHLEDGFHPFRDRSRNGVREVAFIPKELLQISNGFQ